MMWLLGLLACGGEIRKQYEAEKEAVLERADAPTDQMWEEDIILRLSYERLSPLAKQFVQEALSGAKIEKSILGQPLILRPNAVVTQLDLKDAPNKADHVMRFVSTVSGEARWKSGNLKGDLPYEITLKGTVSFPTTNQQASFKVSDVDSVKVNLKGNIPLNITPLLKSWVKEALLNLPVIELYKLKKLDPLRGIRIDTETDSLNVELLSDIPNSTPLSKISKLDSDWDINISDSALIGLARRKAFAMGVISNGVAVDPQRVSFKDNNFLLGLRLWKIEGFGGSWWREYDAEGPVEFKTGRNRIKLKAEKVTEGDKSSGAGLVDPISLLGEGLILTAIEENLTLALPTEMSISIGSKRLIPSIETLISEPKHTQISGSLKLKAPLPKD